MRKYISEANHYKTFKKRRQPTGNCQKNTTKCFVSNETEINFSETKRNITKQTDISNDSKAQIFTNPIYLFFSCPVPLGPPYLKEITRICDPAD